MKEAVQEAVFLWIMDFLWDMCNEKSFNVGVSVLYRRVSMIRTIGQMRV